MSTLSTFLYSLAEKIESTCGPAPGKFDLGDKNCKRLLNYRLRYISDQPGRTSALLVGCRKTNSKYLSETPADNPRSRGGPRVEFLRCENLGTCSHIDGARSNLYVY